MTNSSGIIDGDMLSVGPVFLCFFLDKYSQAIENMLFLFKKYSFYEKIEKMQSSLVFG